MGKLFLQSKTIWGVFITILPTIAPLFGVSFGADDAAMVRQSVDTIVMALGALWAVYGRAVANTPLALK